MPDETGLPEDQDSSSFLRKGWIAHLLQVELVQCLMALLFVGFLLWLSFVAVMRLQGFSYGMA